MAEGDAPRAVRLRRARPADAGALRRAHEAVLEVRYAAAFHDQAAREADDIISWVAVAAADPGAAAGPLAGAEEVVGFVTAKVAGHGRCEHLDGARVLGPEVGHLLSDARVVFYILTLGVLPSHRRRGLATRLVRALVEAAGRHPRARCVCLHVIHYNRAALGFYSSLGFRRVERLRGFYALQPEQAPDPGRLRHDAFLLARYLRGGGPPASLLAHLARWLVGGGADGADAGAGDVEAPEAGLPLADEAEEEDAEGAWSAWAEAWLRRMFLAGGPSPLAASVFRAER